MAKESMVTRTITTTNCKVLCLNIETGECSDRIFVFPRTPKKEKDVIKFAEKELVNEPSVRPVHLVSVDPEQKIYGMTETEFLKYAHEVVRNKKA